MLRVRAARVFTGTQMLTPGELVLEGEAVVAVGAPEEGPGEVVDLGDVTLAPGARLAVATGLAVAIPHGFECLMIATAGRSKS